MQKFTDIKIAIASGKGGTGKTFIATNLFFALQETKRKVCLVDCDAEEPNDILFFTGNKVKSAEVNLKMPVINEDLCTYCGKCHEYCNYNAIFILPPVKVIKVIEDLCHGCGACLAACKFGAVTEKEVSLGQINSYAVSESASIVEARMRVGVFSPVSLIKAAIREAGENLLVIMDSPPGTSCPFIQTVARSDYVILVTEPTPFGLSDLMQSVEILKNMNKPFGVIINRSGLGDRKVYKYLNENNIPLLLEVPFDKEIASVYSKGDLVSRHRPSFQVNLISMLKEISDQYGNIHHKR